MKKLWLLTILLFAPALWGQLSNPALTPWYSATPPTSCPNALPVYIIAPGYTGAGNLYGNNSPTTGTTCSLLVDGSSGGGVTSVSGTANQIDVANGTTTPVISIDSAYAPANLSGGALGSAPYQSAANTTSFIASPTTTARTFVYAWQPSGSAIAPAALDLGTYLASPPSIGTTAAGLATFTTLTGTTVVTNTINSANSSGQASISLTGVSAGMAVTRNEADALPAINAIINNASSTGPALSTTNSGTGDQADFGTGVTITNGGRLTLSGSGNVNGGIFVLSGSPYTAGSGTTNVPLAYMNGGSAPTAWSASGTYLGFNMASGFIGNVFDIHSNGGGSLMSISAAGNVIASGPTNGFGTAYPVAVLGVGTPSSSGVASSTTGRFFAVGPNTINRTADSGTIAQSVQSSFGQPTLQAGAATTYTAASTLYIAGPPIASTNVTITNPWALYVNSGGNYFGGGITNGACSTAGVVTSTSGGLYGCSTLATAGALTTPGTGLSASAGTVSSNAVYQLSFQPGLLTSVTGTIAIFSTLSKASTVDNLVGSAYTFSCVSNPTVTMYECGTSATCAAPTAIGTVTVTAAGTRTNGTITSAAVTAGDSVGWALTAGTCTSLDISATAQVHSN